MPIENPTFSDPGDIPGVPRAWTVRSFVRSQRVAGFGPSPFEGTETFERWSELALRLGVIEQAFFDARPEGYEDFAEGWDADSYSTDFSDVPAEAALFSSEPVDGFKGGWHVESFGWHLDDVTLVTATFAAETAERFERGHRNDNYRWGFTDADLTRATLHGATAETFESTWPAHDERGGGHHGD